MVHPFLLIDGAHHCIQVHGELVQGILTEVDRSALSQHLHDHRVWHARGGKIQRDARNPGQQPVGILSFFNAGGQLVYEHVTGKNVFGDICYDGSQCIED